MVLVGAAEGGSSIAVRGTIVGAVGGYIAAEAGVEGSAEAEPLVADRGVDRSEEVRNGVSDLLDLTGAADEGGTVAAALIVTEDDLPEPPVILPSSS